MASSTPSLPSAALSKRAMLCDRTALLLAAAALVLLQIELIFGKSINWDELFHFSQMHASNRGETVQWLQTPHVWLFSWVPSLPGTPIDQIVLTRLMILPFGLLTAATIFDITRRFTDRHAAAIAALAFIGGGYVFEHAFALRADMIAACLCTGVLWILATRPMRTVWITALLVLAGLAFVATIKSALYAPAFAAMAAWRFRANLRAKPIMYAAGIAAALGLLAVFALPASFTGPIYGLAVASARRMFDGGVFPQGPYFLLQIASAPVLSIGIIFALVRLARPDQRMPWWLVTGLMLPLASVIIYRNAFPYFFAFIMPPVAIGAAAGFAHLRDSFGLKPILAVIVANAALLSIMEPREMMAKQRLVHAGIDEIFGQPTLYIDDIAFRPDYPRAIPQFASGWALENYRKIGEPIYRDTLQEQTVPFLFRQGYALENTQPDAADEMALMPADASALNAHYIQHWGRVFVAGKQFGPSGGAQKFTITIPGTYTVEGSDLLIDGASLAAGKTIALARGDYTLGPVGEAGAALRWGDHSPVPDEPFPEGELFTRY